jgi:acyl-homoserine-lactone acylase
MRRIDRSHAVDSPAPRRGHRAAAALAVAVTFVAACSGDDEAAPTTTIPPSTTTPAPATTTTIAATTTTVFTGYRATIERTSFGVAHITADDWGSLGFGQGYAFAQDRACTLLDRVITVRGERAKWLGPGDDDENVTSDLAYRHLGLHRDADARFADQPAEIDELITGYVAGFNEQLAAEGTEGPCAGQAWVAPITTTDLWAHLNDVLLFASSGVLIDQIGTATPPEPESSDDTTPPTTAADSVPPTTSPDDAPATTATAAPMVDLRPALGSNGWAIGADASTDGGGLLLANPHFPWTGHRRLWESQLTLTTGELDVYGATLSGVPGVLIGFNDHVGWTHTVSAGNRMTLYSLTLVDGEPTSYVYGDEIREMVPTEITVEVLGDDGSTEEVTRTMWASHYGPMLNLPTGWSTDTAYTLRDANLDSPRIVEQFLGMAQADGMDAFIDVHREVNAIPWVNTIAVSADGRAWYADTAATPKLSDEAIAGYLAALDAGGTAALFAGNGAVLLDGSDPINEWVDDPDAARPGLLPFDEQPQLERADFVFNANDSHWLAHPDELLTGFSPLTGREQIPQSARTRMNAILLTDPSVRGDDGTFDAAEIEAAIFSNRALHVELLLDGVLAACERTPLVLVDDRPFSVTEACEVLAGWDRRLDPASRGAALWRWYLSLFSADDRSDAGALYAVPFDPADPVGTPNTANDALDVELLANLGVAAKAMEAAGVPLDVALGEVQYDGRDGVDDPLPLGGGTATDGSASIVGGPGQGDNAVTFGNSFMMVLEFTADGPVARAVLTYGQPDDPADPQFTSQTEVYSSGALRPVVFTRDAIESDPEHTSLEVTGPRP